MIENEKRLPLGSRGRGLGIHKFHVFASTSWSNRLSEA